jgi:hypothetical protein
MSYDISALNGRHVVHIEGLEEGSERVVFTCSDGTEWTMCHKPDCCECVQVEDVVGDVDDLHDARVIDARCETNSDSHPEGWNPHFVDESFTWTFYIIQTDKGAVTIRWLGSSNGCYSEGVDFDLTKSPRGVLA